MIEEAHLLQLTIYFLFTMLYNPFSYAVPGLTVNSVTYLWLQLRNPNRLDSIALIGSKHVVITAIFIGNLYCT